MPGAVSSQLSELPSQNKTAEVLSSGQKMKDSKTKHNYCFNLDRIPKYKGSSFSFFSNTCNLTHVKQK